MGGPSENSPATAAPTDAAAEPSKPAGRSWLNFIKMPGWAKTVSASALIVSGLGWLFHNYGSPVASSVWDDMIRPRVNKLVLNELLQSPRMHEFMVTEINDYLAGTIPSSDKRNEIGVKLKALADSSDKIEALSNSLFGSVDSVYTVATDFSLEQIKDTARNTISFAATETVTGPVRLFVYAHPTQHCVWAFLQAKGELQRGVRRERLSFTITLNDN